MWIKLTIIAFLAFIVLNLGAALFYMLRDRGRSTKTLTSLKLRVGASLLFVVLLILARVFGLLSGNPDPITGM